MGIPRPAIACGRDRGEPPAVTTAVSSGLFFPILLGGDNCREKLSPTLTPISGSIKDREKTAQFSYDMVVFE